MPSCVGRPSSRQGHQDVVPTRWCPGPPIPPPPTCLPEYPAIHHLESRQPLAPTSFQPLSGPQVCHTGLHIAWVLGTVWGAAQMPLWTRAPCQPPCPCGGPFRLRGCSFLCGWGLDSCSGGKPTQMSFGVSGGGHCVPESCLLLQGAPSPWRRGFLVSGRHGRPSGEIGGLWRGPCGQQLFGRFPSGALISPEHQRCPLEANAKVCEVI